MKSQLQTLQQQLEALKFEKARQDSMPIRGTTFISNNPESFPVMQGNQHANKSVFQLHAELEQLNRQDYRRSIVDELNRRQAEQQFVPQQAHSQVAAQMRLQQQAHHNYGMHPQSIQHQQPQGHNNAMPHHFTHHNHGVHPPPGGTPPSYR